MPLHRLQVTCALITRGKTMLLARRGDTGLWELPGGKREKGETLEACLVREIREELGAGVNVHSLLTVSRANPELELSCYFCETTGQPPRPLEHTALAWVAPVRALSLELGRADREIIISLINQGVLSTCHP